MNYYASTMLIMAVLLLIMALVLSFREYDEALKAKTVNDVFTVIEQLENEGYVIIIDPKTNEQIDLETAMNLSLGKNIKECLSDIVEGL